MTTTDVSTRHLARSRGATSGILLVLLGAWGGLAPFVGPLFDFAFTPDASWHWTSGRGWYEVLPGGVTVLGGLLLLAATSRATTLLGAWLGIVGGGWFVIGPAISTQLSLGSIGEPTGTSGAKRALELLAFFYLLGALILFLAAAAFGRLSVVTVRDVRVAERRAEAEESARQAEAAREADNARRVEAARQADAERRQSEAADQPGYAQQPGYVEHQSNAEQQGNAEQQYAPEQATQQRPYQADPAPQEQYQRDTTSEQAPQEQYQRDTTPEQAPHEQYQRDATSEQAPQEQPGPYRRQE